MLVATFSYQPLSRSAFHLPPGQYGTLFVMTLVMNLISIKAPPVDGAKVRQSIEAALERQAEREAKRVWFQIDDGVVEIFGTVHSRAEREAVIGAAKGTPGVRRVEDKLRIEPSF